MCLIIAFKGIEAKSMRFAVLREMTPCTPVNKHYFLFTFKSILIVAKNDQ